jgi:Domain of unknown function (DUF222)
MFADIDAGVAGLRRAAVGLDIKSLTGLEAARLVKRLGTAKRLCDGMLARAGLRVDETGAHQGHGTRTAAEFCATHGSMDNTEARAAIDTARLLSELPEVYSAVRDGELSVRHAAMIAPIAKANPDAVGGLITAAKQGTVALREACAEARAGYEDELARVARQRGRRSFRMWTGDDGMLEGRFALTPEIGGQVKAVLERAAQQRFKSDGDRIDQVTADVFAEIVIRNGFSVFTVNANQPNASQPSNNSSDDGKYSADESTDNELPNYTVTTRDGTTTKQPNGTTDGEHCTSPRERSGGRSNGALPGGLFDDDDSDSAPDDGEPHRVDDHETGNGVDNKDDANGNDVDEPVATFNGGSTTPSKTPATSTDASSAATSATRAVDDLAVPNKSSAVKASVHVVIDHAALVRGNSLPGETCELVGVGKVNVQWVRQLLGDAFVSAVIKNGKDIKAVAHFKRGIPSELRTALIAGGRECVIDQCRCRSYLEIDHQDIDFAKGGPTAWWNLAWMCSQHHRLKTSGWTLGPPDSLTGKRQLQPPLCRSG